MSRRPKGEIVAPGVLEPMDLPSPAPVADMTVTQAKKAAINLGMLVLRGFNVQELKDLGINVSGDGAIDVGRGLMMVAAGCAHDGIKMCSSRMEASDEPETFTAISECHSQYVGHLIEAASVLVKPDPRPPAQDSNTPQLPSYNDPPEVIQQHLHLHTNV